MRAYRPLLWPILASFAFLVPLGSSTADTKTAPGTPGQEPKGSIPCAQAAEALQASPVAQRLEAAHAILQRNCKPMPSVIWNTVLRGKWGDDLDLGGGERTTLLAWAIESHYAEAETLAVQLLENGAWPGAREINMEEGSRILRSLHGSLTPYRIRLFLDIYNQQIFGPVRVAIVEALRGSELDEAALPALDAYWQEKGPLQEAGAASIQATGEKSADAVLARVIHKLPPGPMLNWALGLAISHPSAAVAAAKRERGL